MPHRIIKRVQRLLNGRERVEAVQVINVYIIRFEPPQASFDLPRQMVSRRTHIVWTVAKKKGPFRGDEDAVTRRLPDRLAQNLLGDALRVNIRSIKKIYSGFQTDRDEARCLFHIRFTPRSEELICSSKRSGAKTKDRDLQSALSQLSKFHIDLDTETIVPVAARAQSSYLLF